MSQSQLLDLIDDTVKWGEELGLSLLEAEDDRLDGRSVLLGGTPRRQFFSCSYLGLELHPALRRGAIDAIERFGTQFSSSRTYISAPMYGALEEKLGVITGGHCMVAPNTTLGTMSTLPVIIGEGDAVLLDQQVHHTVQLVVPQLQALGIPVTMIRHGDLGRLEDEICRLRSSHRRIWYLADGVYSMFGDVAPMKNLAVLLDRYEQLNLYIDDAHGTSWAGTHGRGVALEALGGHDRVYVALSLNKSFGAGGGAVVFPDAESCRRVRACGGPMIFTGPLQPPILGAAMASADLHLSDLLPTLQDELLERIRFVNRRSKELDLPFGNRAQVPVRFLGLGTRDAVTFMAKELLDRGMLTNCAVFPAVPAHQSGLRFTVTRHNRMEDLEDLLVSMAELLPKALEQGEIDRPALNRAFKLEEARSAAEVAESTRGLTCEHFDSITEIDAKTWDSWMQGRGSFDAEGCRSMEAMFSEDRKPEERCRFHYFVIRDPKGAPVLATFMTESLMKDDMFAEPGVSKAIEEKRKEDPSYLTSKVLAMGCPLTEGDHLWLDRTRDWKGALHALAIAAGEIVEASELDLIALRDLPAGEDPELQEALEDCGFHGMELPASMVTPVAESRDAMIEALSRRGRRFQAEEVEPNLDKWEPRVLKAEDISNDPTLCAHLYQLYRNVWERSFHMNTFALPEDFPKVLLSHDDWELLALYSRGESEGPPRAFLAARVSGDAYVPLVVGLDYRFVSDDGVYRQCIHHALERAREHGAKRVLMGMGAELEKRRFGAQPENRRLFVRARDHYQADVLTLLAGTVHLQDKS